MPSAHRRLDRGGQLPRRASHRPEWEWRGRERADPRRSEQLSDWQTLGAASEYTGPVRSFGPNGNNPYGQVSVTLLLGQGAVVSTANSRLNLAGLARFGDDFAGSATLRITGRNSSGALGTWVLCNPVCLNSSTRVVATNAFLSLGSFSVEGRVTRAL